MSTRKIEIYTGLFIAFGMFCFGYVAINLGGISLFSESRYALKAKFTSVSGLKNGALVEIAGVEVGKVEKIVLEKAQAILHMKIKNSVRIESDAIASIRTRGLIGEKFVKITPGSETDSLLKTNEEITETESVVDLEELIGKFIYDKK